MDNTTTSIGSDFSMESRIKDLLLDDSVRRATIFSFLLGAVFTAYGFTSYDFLIRFDPNLNLWDNLWQRILFNSTPMLLIGGYLKLGTASNRIKMIIWMVGFCCVFHVGAWINVWPVILSGQPIVLAYVHAANVYLFAFCYVFVSPPGRYLWYFTMTLFLMFVGPLFIVAHIGNDPVLFKLTINDTLFTIISGVAGSHMIQSIRRQVAYFEIEKEATAKTFLGPILSQAIYKNRQELFASWRGDAFVATLDMRDSTEWQKRNPRAWLQFRQEYFKAVSEITTRYEGYIQKTVGDSHVIDFGIMEHAPDLSELPGIHAELNLAEKRRLERASANTFDALDDIFGEFHRLAEEHFEGCPIFLGAGVDLGVVERSVQGDLQGHAELDVNGVPVNCSNRLQEYGKHILSVLGRAGSLIVVSAKSLEYLPPDKQSAYLEFRTTANPVRNFSNLQVVHYRTVESAENHSAVIQLAG